MILKIKVNGEVHDIQDSRVNATTIASMLDAANYVPSAASSGTTYNLTLNGTTAGDNAGTSLGSFYAPTSAGTSGQTLISNGSGAPTWGTPSTSVVYGDVTYGVYAPATATSGTIALNYNNGPVQVIKLSSTASGVTTSNIPAGHSLHVFFVSDSTSAARAITIKNNATTSYCPGGANVSFTAPKSGAGYVEVDFLKANGVIYVRGV